MLHAILEEQQRKQQEQKAERVQRAKWAAERQTAIDDEPRLKYAVIVAVDQLGGFAKDNKIPWDFPADRRWFEQRTKDGICVMGKNTYYEINEMLGEKAKESVLPGRKCFVMSNSLTELPNAKVIKSFGDLSQHLDDEEREKTIFIIGGDLLYREGIAIADTAYVTVINDNYDCDMVFPVDYLTKFFYRSKMYKKDEEPKLRFTVWQKKT